MKITGLITADTTITGSIATGEMPATTFTAATDMTGTTATDANNFSIYKVNNGAALLLQAAFLLICIDIYRVFRYLRMLMFFHLFSQFIYPASKIGLGSVDAYPVAVFIFSDHQM